MISLATPRDQLGTAFGVHRALDTTGAVLGPIVAFAMLAVAPLAFHSLFLVSFFGQKLFDWLKHAPTSVWIGLGIGIATLAIGVILFKRRRVS